MTKRKKLIIAASLIPVAGLIAYGQIQDLVKSRSDRVIVSGNIEITDAEVSFKVAGHVEKRLVSEGESVRAGQVVARLDSEELSRQLELQKADLRVAEAELAEYEAGSRPEEIEQGRSAVKAAEADRERLETEYRRQADLYAKKVASPRDYDAAKSAYDMAAARLQDARERLTLLKKGPRAEKTEQSRARLERARLAVSVAETKLGYTTITAPFSGIVLSENAEAGEYVSAGTPVVTIGDLENVWLRAYINETDLGRVKVGQAVEVTADTYPDKIYRGRVSFISPEAEFTPKNVQTHKERVKLVYRIKVDIKNPGMELKPGMIFTIEPMINAGKKDIRVLGDGWTVVTKDHSLSAQWEHTVLVTPTGFEVLTVSAGSPPPPGFISPSA